MFTVPDTKNEKQTPKTKRGENEMNNKKTYALLIILALALVLQISVQPNFAKETSLPSDWAISYVAMARELNLIPQSMELDYQKAITRQEFCRLIVQTYETLSGVTLETAAVLPFTDTTDEWVSKAYKKGIVNGISEKSFAPNHTITRQEIMVMMYRCIQFMEKDLGRDILADQLENTTIFQDDHMIASWAKEAVTLATANELVKGVGQNKILPQGKATVEEAITLITRVASFVDASEEEYFFEQDNFVKGGRWWIYDYAINSMSEKFEFTNVKEAYPQLVLKRDGSILVEDLSTSTWKPFGLHHVSHISKNPANYDAKFYALCLDGSVWECDAFDLSYQQVSLEEKIRLLKVGRYVTYVVSESGKVYYWNTATDVKVLEELSQIIDISVSNEISRGLDQEGNVWEWTMNFEDQKPILESPEKTELSGEYLDYYHYVTIEESDLSEGQFIRFDDSNGKLFMISADKKLYSYNVDAYQYNYKVLPIEVRDVKGYTFLDSSGTVMEYMRPSKADGYQFMNEPRLIPGLTGVVAIDQDIALRKDGSIWSWGYRYPQGNLEEHQIGQLDKSLKASDFTRIIHYKGYVYLLNQAKQVWQLEDYTTQKEKARIGAQTPVLFLEAIQDLGYGWFLNIQGQVGSYDVTGEHKLILEQVIQISSNENVTLALDETGKLYSMSSWSLTEYSEIENVSRMSKVWVADMYNPYLAVAETKEGNLVLVTTINDYDQTFEGTGQYEIPFNIKNYEDFYFTGMDIMVKKQSGITKAWFIYESYFLFNGKEKEFGPESGLKLMVNGGNL